MRRFTWRSVAAGFLIGITLIFLSTVAIIPNDAGRHGIAVTRNGDQADGADGSRSASRVPGARPGGPVATMRGNRPSTETRDLSGTKLSCTAGGNGGETDTGVSANSIKLGSTIVESGIGASFLGEARDAMEAVRSEVNRSGGICGRLLHVLYKDDAWSAQQGFTFIRNLVEAEKVFALVVVPSSEGLHEASSAGYLRRTRVPVVGSDGMIRTQYTDPYVFPVATATVSLMHVMAKDAWNRGARKFGLVFEKTYRFGVEGAYAFNQAFRRLTKEQGGTPRDIPGFRDPFRDPLCEPGTQFCALEANQGSYSAQVAAFNQGCFHGQQENWCDFVALLLEPATALQWMLDENAVAANVPKYRMGAAQPLFTFDFGAECGDKCDGLRIWTGYNPPIEQYTNAPAVRRYVDDLRVQNAQADEFNQFSLGSYLGMTLVAEAIRRVGPNLTRDALMDTLNSMTLETGLSPPLTWRAGNHFANPAAQAFEIQARNGFSGWRFAQGYVRDPWLGQDVG